jgi:nucleoside-diphosphate-sugar epimerase
MRVFITGATGLLGRAIAAHLIEQGHRVVALVRPQADATFLRDIGADLKVGSLTEIGSDSSAFDGCDGLVHAAALVSPAAGWDEYERVNVDGTRAVFHAAARAGVARALYVSSVGVYGAADQLAGRVVDETAPIDRPVAERNFYARSKRLAEQVAESFHRDGRLRVSIVRPCFVYGEADRLVVPRVVRLVQPHIITTVGSGQNLLALVYAGNVAEGAVLALVSEAAAGRAYNLANDFPVTQRELFRLAASATGGARVIVPMPVALARALLRKSSPIRQRGLAFLALHNPFVSNRARQELGWSPRTPHQVALPRAIAWHLAHARGMTSPA